MHLDIEQTSDTRCFFLYKIPDFETLRISITLNQLKTLISYEHYTNISNICQKHWKKKFGKLQNIEEAREHNC